MRESGNIRDVEQLGIDWMGFIFWSGSRRYVSQRPAYLPTKCKRVGIFVDASIADICQHIADYALDLVQLHGLESPEFVRTLRASCSDAIAIIKAFNIATTADLKATEPYEELVDYFLFDTKGKSVGGNGEKFDWSVLADYAGETPFLLSGGIGPDDAGILNPHCAILHSKCVGFDLNSRFEVRPGLKDIDKLKRFLHEQD